MYVCMYVRSAGLVLHPRVIRLTREYQKKHYLNRNVHLWPLSFLPKTLAEGLIRQFQQWCSGILFYDGTNII